ncbi:zona pelucida superfamily protein qsm [Arctopsyche grandis]|uniref:zona pelucida superfamily protein qsm n=1 Tax=Arctopsyche grandis TaxID=121162 RepID=UPI00406D85E3
MAVFKWSSACLTIVFLCCLPTWTQAKGKQAKVNCVDDSMTVVVPLDTENEKAYLDQLKGYDICAPSIEDGAATFRLDLNDVHKCGVTRLLHQPTGKRVFYHKIIVESESGREIVSVRCSLGPIVPVGPHQIHRRDLDLPVGFQEPENLEITTSLTERAPEPQLGVSVSQDGKEVSGEISVRPGTPLAMKVFLDKGSAPVYGLMVSHLQVSDTVAQQETIVFNGCSVDPYLFDNFVTTDGDTLEAKFRAFKFPDTTYVQFRGTVNVCLDKCQGTQCSNGATGYGRKKRSILSGNDSNRLFEISLTTFIKVEDDSNESDDIAKLLRNLKVANQMLEENSPRMVVEDNSDEVLTATVREKPQNVDAAEHAYNVQNESIRFGASIVFIAVAIALQFLFVDWRQ